MNETPSSPTSLTAAVLERCRSLGFALAGVAQAGPTRYREHLEHWLRTGQHGEMAYMENCHEQRCDPRVLLPGAQSIICVADRYNTGMRDRRTTDAPTRGRIARYARGKDYHRVMKKRLHQLADELAREHPAEQFKACVDTAPVLERELAQRAGLGAVGKHTLLIEPGIGSYLMLGEIITTLALDPTPSKEHVDPCESCARCIDACPTDAITPWSVDATKCISYLTIEHRSEIHERYFTPSDDWLFGCDICQEVCPHNQSTRKSRHASVHEAYTPRRDGFDLLEVLGWSEDDRRSAFISSAMKRAKLAMMKRNALIVAGNALAQRDDPELLKRISELADDPNEDELVRETAQRVLDRVKG
jgi:epoxyqueuosine reductase